MTLLEQTEISQEEILKNLLKQLNGLESNKERNEFIAGALASFQMQTLTMGQYLTYIHSWIVLHLSKPGMRTFFDPDEFVALISMPPDEFKEWFAKKRSEDRQIEQTNKPKIILLG